MISLRLYVHCKHDRGDAAAKAIVYRTATGPVWTEVN